MSPMRNIWAIYKKELRLYFQSPIAYAVLTIFLILMGWIQRSLTLNPAPTRTSGGNWRRRSAGAGGGC